MASWIFNLSDTSPVLQYQPYGDGPLESGWQVGYTGSGLNPNAEGQVGSGDSYHTTTSSSANVTLDFFGIGIILLGNANCSYTVSRDGTPVGTGSPPSGTLYSETSLQSSLHTVVLSPQPASEGQGLNFTGAQLISSVTSELSSTTVDNQDVTKVVYQGTWFNNTNIQIPNATDPQQFFQTNQSNASASLNFRGRAVSVNGESNEGFGVYQVQLDTSIYTLNASSQWLVPNVILFFMDGLDESQSHTVKLTNTISGENLALNFITIYASQSSTSTSPQSSPDATASAQVSSHHSLSSGAIAGIVIGALAMFLLSALSLVYYLRLRTRSNQNHRSPMIEPFEERNDYDASNASISRMGESSRELSSRNTTLGGGKITSRSGEVVPSISTRGTVASSSGNDFINPVFAPPPINTSDLATSHRRNLSPSLVPEDVTDNARESIVPRGQVSRSGAAARSSQSRRGRTASTSAHSAVLSSNSARSMDRLADVLTGRLLERFGSARREEDIPPPSYSFHEPQ